MLERSAGAASGADPRRTGLGTDGPNSTSRVQLGLTASQPAATDCSAVATTTWPSGLQGYNGMELHRPLQLNQQTAVEPLTGADPAGASPSGAIAGSNPTSMEVMEVLEIKADGSAALPDSVSGSGLMPTGPVGLAIANLHRLRMHVEGLSGLVQHARLPEEEPLAIARGARLLQELAGALAEVSSPEVGLDNSIANAFVV